MFKNRLGSVSVKMLLLFFVLVVLVGSLIYVAFTYPQPASDLAVGSIGGFERLENYRNPQTGNIEIEVSDINLFFNSVEWQNISKDPEMVEAFKNKEVMTDIICVLPVYNIIDLYQTINQAVSRENFNDSSEIEVFVSNFFDNPENFKIEQNIYIHNLIDEQIFSDLFELITFMLSLLNTSDDEISESNVQKASMDDYYSGYYNNHQITFLHLEY